MCSRNYCPLLKGIINLPSPFKCQNLQRAIVGIKDSVHIVNSYSRIFCCEYLMYVFINISVARAIEDEKFIPAYPLCTLHRSMTQYLFWN